jgi:hypothetical protein
VVGRPRAAAAWAALLLATFSLELLRIGRRADGPVPCGCFGAWASVRTSTALWRNAGLGGIAALVVALGTDASTLGWPGPPAPSELLPLALTLATLAAAGIVARRAMVWLAPERRS